MKRYVIFALLCVTLVLLFLSVKMLFIPYVKRCEISKLRNLYIKEDLLPRLYMTCQSVKSDQLTERSVRVICHYTLPVHLEEVAYMYEYANTDIEIPTIPLGAFITTNTCDMNGEVIQGLQDIPSPFLILNYMFFASKVNATGIILSFDGYPEIRRDFGTTDTFKSNDIVDIQENLPLESLERLVLFYSKDEFNNDGYFPDKKMLLPEEFPVDMKQIEQLTPQLSLILSDGKITEPIPIWCEPSEMKISETKEN